ncbi:MULTISPECIES: endonuclease/exonuclease/phosphatase family protein [Arenibacter]|uniref:endonuclease/exonuclease/phosphatase family protein n=1 Tax=Arenibacter TaxID=178469 RepID=UPI0004DFAB9B|nr:MULTISPECIES: endonuclease/exonuclease/phosphatase family protein [Arenibacter]GBF19549.1 endonuclease/Exonuclease/phosphatase family protein [Arenibacter sp. NBRC 103722]
MKNLNFIDKFLFFINAIFALLLLISCFVPQIPVTHFAYFSILSLTVPVLVLFNLLFLTYWLAKRKRQLLLSAFVLLLGYICLGNFFRFKLAEEVIEESDLSVMSYNVRGFNKYDLLNDPSAEGRIMEFISSEAPDILCIQEFSRIKDRQLKKMYPFKFITDYRSNEGKSTQAIYSKFVIINSGSMDFPNSGNNALYADIVVNKDTIRVYNLHLESHRIIPSVRRLSNEPKGRLLKRLSKSFAKQGEQAQLVEKDIEATPYKKIVCGDFNNTQFSNVYKVIKGDMQDSFTEQGTGYGRTFNFRYYPVRIDFILADEAFEIMAHKNFDIKLSDHFPVMASIKIGSN